MKETCKNPFQVFELVLCTARHRATAAIASANLTRLYTHNAQVDKWNEFQLSGLPGDDAVLDAVQTGPDHQRAFLVKNLLTPATLHTAQEVDREETRQFRRQSVRCEA